MLTLLPFLPLFFCFLIWRIKGEECTFTVKDIPIPEDSVLFGDPRRNEKCKRTSFDDTKPSNLFNPDGLRMWSREENSMSISTNPKIYEYLQQATGKDPFFFSQFVRLIYPNIGNQNGAFQYINIPKTGSSTMGMIFRLPKRRTPESLQPKALQLNFTLSTIRHPITRLISGIGTLTHKANKVCVLQGVNFKICNDMIPIMHSFEGGIVTNKTIEMTLEVLERDGYGMCFDEEILYPDEHGIQLKRKNNPNLPISVEDIPSAPHLPFPMQEMEGVIRRLGNGIGRKYLIGRVYIAHVMSQMNFFNIYPPSHLYNTENNADEVNGVDSSLRQEKFDDGIELLQETFPDILGKIFRTRGNHIRVSNYHEGRSSHLKDHEIVYSCKIAWRMYRYYIQDFECLGYEMPPSCLRRECREGD